MKSFHNGFVVIPSSHSEISVGDSTTHLNLYKVVEDRNLIPVQMSKGCDIAINKCNIEPLVDEVFAIGDHVKVINGTFTGVVIGFEFHTNSAVCVSDKIDRYRNDRTRYSYNVNELEIYNPNRFVFQIGRRYRINDSIQVCAYPSIKYTDHVTLYHINGQVYIESLPRNTTLCSLACHNGISKIKEL